MRHFLRVMWAEARKQHRVYFHDAIIYFSMFVWPILELLTAIYMFKPFSAGESTNEILRRALGGQSVEIFLLVGYLGYNFFFSLVQSAWRFTFERYDGTLELIFLSPASRFAVVLGNAMSTLVESMWLLTVFAGAIYFLSLGGGSSPDVGLLLLGLLVTVVTAVAWGALLNTFFLMTRDSSLFYTILQEPLNFFGGVRLPIHLFTSWMQTISYALPLTYCLIILRKIISQGSRLADLSGELISLGILIAIMLAAAYLLLRVAERHVKKNGTLMLF